MTTEIDVFDPCNEGKEFRDKYSSFKDAWNNCPRGDWMLWIANKLNVDIRVLTLTKGYCANTVIHLMKDKRSKLAVKAAIDFGNNKIDNFQLGTAAHAAYAAAYAYADAYADATAYAANQLETANICRRYLNV
jgi:hypothetical protein